MSRREDRNLLRIDAQGRVLGIGPLLAEQLRPHKGLYGFAVGADGALRFEKVDVSPSADEYHQPIILQGDIGAMGSTVEVINFVNSAQMTGNLVLLADGLRKAIYFQNGEVRGASSNRVEDRLGEIMYRFGALSRQSLDEAIEASRKRRRPLGNYLLDEGIITQADLYRYVRRQVEEIFYSTLLLKDGQFFLTRFDAERLPSPISLNAQSLLMEGLRRMDEMAYFRQKIAGPHTRLARKGDAQGSSELGAKERAVLDALSQPSTVEQVTLACRLGAFETTKMLHRLLDEGLLEVVDDAADVPAQSLDGEVGKMVDTFNSVFERIFQAISRHGREDALEQGLETFLQFYGFVELFQGVKFDQAGRLDKAKLLENLRANQADNRLSFLQQALNELLFFEMFAAREWLERDEQHELQKIINQLFIDIG
ncbi:MAG: DUF4388 domain-containing protein [Myxococcales bacterium]|nr:DUF4388 domain-containing protein [Myxococcales bacterium]MCB9522164.1 DUF4388 domain-containing protein [Myxococcales bacterium]